MVHTVQFGALQSYNHVFPKPNTGELDTIVGASKIGNIPFSLTGSFSGDVFQARFLTRRGEQRLVTVPADERSNLIERGRVSIPSSVRFPGEDQLPEVLDEATETEMIRDTYELRNRYYIQEGRRYLP